MDLSMVIHATVVIMLIELFQLCHKSAIFRAVAMKTKHVEVHTDWMPMVQVSKTSQPTMSYLNMQLSTDGSK